MMNPEEMMQTIHATGMSNKTIFALSIGMAAMADVDFVKVPRAKLAGPKGGKVPPAVYRSHNQTPKISGGERNSPCPCGSGKKRKKCACGGVPTIKEVVPPAHTMGKTEYEAHVMAFIEKRHGIDKAVKMNTAYRDSHIYSYWADQVITPERCADLIEEMLAYDEENETATYVRAAGDSSIEAA